MTLEEGGITTSAIPERAGFSTSMKVSISFLSVIFMRRRKSFTCCSVPINANTDPTQII